MAVRGRPGRAELHLLDCEGFEENEQERHVVRRRAGMRGFMMGWSLGSGGGEPAIGG